MTGLAFISAEEATNYSEGASARKPGVFKRWHDLFVFDNERSVLVYIFLGFLKRRDGGECWAGSAPQKMNFSFKVSHFLRHKARSQGFCLFRFNNRVRLSNLLVDNFQEAPQNPVGANVECCQVAQIACVGLSLRKPLLLPSHGDGREDASDTANCLYPCRPSRFLHPLGDDAPGRPSECSYEAGAGHKADRARNQAELADAAVLHRNAPCWVDRILANCGRAARVH